MGDIMPDYNEDVQRRYNKSDKGRSRKRKWADNMTEEQREKQRIAKRESARRRRAKQKENE